MENLVVFKGYTSDKEVFAIKKEYPVIKISRIVEVPASQEVRKLYTAQKNKFTKRRDWGVAWLNRKND